MSMQLIPSSEIEMMLEMSRNFIVKADDHEIRIQILEKTSICDSRKRQQIKKRAVQHTSTILGGKNSDQYKAEFRTTISALWRDFWDAFGVTTYHDTPALMYDAALQYIDEWRPRLKIVTTEGV
jgi:hypothetical protein